MDGSIGSACSDFNHPVMCRRLRLDAWCCGQGATNVVLEGVFHSMSRVGTYGQPAERPWYGSDAVVDAWAQFLL